MAIGCTGEGGHPFFFVLAWGTSAGKKNNKKKINFCMAPNKLCPGFGPLRGNLSYIGGRSKIFFTLSFRKKTTKEFRHFFYSFFYKGFY